MAKQDVLGPRMLRGFTLWRKHFAEIVDLLPSDVLIVSYPKSGRTWHRVLLAHYISAVFYKESIRSIDVAKLTRQGGLPRVDYTHNGANFLNAIPPAHRFNADPLLWRRRKIILLVRDPRDVLVSAHAHAKHRRHSFVGTLSEFVRHPYTGIEKILVAQSRWHAYKVRVPAVLILKYEDMHRDPVTALSSTLAFIGIPAAMNAIAEAATFARFENMKKLEATGYFSSNKMRSRDGSESAMKVRSGKVGGYKSELGADDLAYIEDIRSKVGDPLGSFHDPADKER